MSTKDLRLIVPACDSFPFPALKTVSRGRFIRPHVRLLIRSTVLVDFVSVISML